MTEIEWRTDNLALAAWLAMELPIDRMEWEDSTCYWVFTRSDDLEEDVTEFMMGEPMVNAREYNDKLDALKRSIFNSRPDVSPRRKRV